jgi:anti-sigma regulatory factor (Ser/Thr protein kinase)
MSPADAVPRNTIGADPQSGVIMQLERARTAGAVARRAIRTRLDRRVAQETLDDVLLVVSELLANAVLHGSSEISLRVELIDGCVTGRVTDGGSRPGPRVVVPRNERTSANGLRLVDRITSEWGVDAGSADVWFRIDDRGPV